MTTVRPRNVQPGVITAQARKGVHQPFMTVIVSILHLKQSHIDGEKTISLYLLRNGWLFVKAIQTSHIHTITMLSCKSEVRRCKANELI